MTARLLVRFLFPLGRGGEVRRLLRRRHAAVPLAAEIPPADRRSGYDFMSRETRAMQDDDTANPACCRCSTARHCGRPRRAAERSCADCHGDARTSMKGVAARYPPSSRRALARSISKQRINMCRTEHQRRRRIHGGERGPARAGRLRRLPVARLADHGADTARASHSSISAARAVPPPARSAQSVVQPMP